MTQTSTPTYAAREQQFVARVLEQCKKDNGFAARLRRADNPDTEYYALGDLAKLGIDITDDSQRLPCALVAAALSRDADTMNTDGTLGIGAALRQCLPDEEAEDSPRLRRLLACESLHETCQVLRPMLSLVRSKGVRLGYARLLHDLRSFRFGKEAAQKAKRQWVSDFYRKAAASDKDGETRQGEA